MYNKDVVMSNAMRTTKQNILLVQSFEIISHYLLFYFVIFQYFLFKNQRMYTHKVLWFWLKNILTLSRLLITSVCLIYTRLQNIDHFKFHIRNMTKTKRVLIDLGMCSWFFPKHTFRSVAYYQTMLHEIHISKKYWVPKPAINDSTKEMLKFTQLNLIIS